MIGGSGGSLRSPAPAGWACPGRVYLDNPADDCSAADVLKPFVVVVVIDDRYDNENDLGRSRNLFTAQVTV
ncbi:hypothetical protein SAMN05421783_110160 [Thiocapsa roseopersicina]|uniref:Uncharacterized protein n=1 Tax=Thiocapsa roseopersicina TaxID=1058 RepID=A0A1H2XE73_THIRO|nr:hypothetical protein SAMN05421783_110160 [Thiocapsa roseopersicina]